MLLLELNRTRALHYLNLFWLSRHNEVILLVKVCNGIINHTYFPLVEPPREREGLSPLSEYDIGCSECSDEDDEVTPTADHSHPRHQVKVGVCLEFYYLIVFTNGKPPRSVFQNLNFTTGVVVYSLNDHIPNIMLNF